ncbi:hypothetical protein V1956_05070 [Yersinia sp. 2540 StPb PI]|uniref:hypothetical protein n=1 Tax=Yersinia sp. 2540 StPb PI TaxID=3117406 RepID=UPI003FA47259
MNEIIISGEQVRLLRSDQRIKNGIEETALMALDKFADILDEKDPQIGVPLRKYQYILQLSI